MLPKQHASSSGKQVADSTFPVTSAFMGHCDDGSDASLGYRSTQNHPQPYSSITRIGKVDFPRFDGSQIRDWVFKVEEFFEIDFTPADMKVRMAAIHFDGRASTWHHNMLQTPGPKRWLRDWYVYKSLIMERFEDVLDDPVAELKRLQEMSGIEDYHEKFELIKTRVNLNEEYLVSTYLAGLRLETQMHVRMFDPQSIRQCLVLGRLYEKAHPPHKQPYGGTYTKQVPKKEFKEPTQQLTPYDQRMPPRKLLSQAELSERRAKGLCFQCDEKYTPDHYLKHKKTQIYILEVEDDVEESDMDISTEQPLVVHEENNRPQASVSAVSGVADYTTMKVRGYHEKRVIFLLLDTGSTHNFMDPKTAELLGVRVTHASCSTVSVADGSQLGVQGKVDKFKWEFHGTKFQVDFMIIPLGNCDVVLGVQWLVTLGDITLNLKKLEMSFVTDNTRVRLHGIKQGSFREVKTLKFNQKQESQVQISMICANTIIAEPDIQLCAIQGNASNQTSLPAITQLQEEFSDIFAEPTELPAFRENHNHKIPVKEGVDPINQRSYRYAIHQKNEIDKMVEEMLTKGIIQPISSPYASPVVLVKKKDGTWRLCVDYRGLNGVTIKNRFPIPLIEDLMDELGGAVIFSKIDLRAGYHQVRMDPTDICKTAFKTHCGHFEYVVMPFGLTNAQASFQGLMNDVFRKFLRKFVLIFFDDILIYSSSMEEHLQHLRLVFQTMREHSLFAKESKCEFATDKVEYLGHYIAANGVSTDPNKIQAAADWPIPQTLKQLRGFLGLAGYYRRFVKNFGTIARPLTLLTKKDAFEWSTEASAAFQVLKSALCHAPVLALPLFDKPFIVETDACTQGIGAVLMQEGHPLAYISRHLKGKQINNFWLLCLLCRSGGIIYCLIILSSRPIKGVSSIFWNSDSIPLYNNSGFPNSLNLIMKSNIVRAKKMWRLMHYLV